MTDVNRSEPVLEALKERGYRMTPQRRAIVAEIMGTEGHISAQDLAARVKDRLPGVNDSTVYRTLELLEDLGFLSHAHLESGFEYHHAADHDHVHLICERCGRADALSVDETEPLRELISGHRGFVPDFTHFAISGVCAECQRAGAKP